MAQVSNLSAIQPANNTQAEQSFDAKLSTKDFMKILTEELKNQNPLEPLKQGEFIGQLTGMQRMSVLNQLQDVVSSMDRFQKLSTASSMVGKDIKGVTVDGNNVQGPVEKVSVRGQDVFLHVSGFDVPVDNVTEIGK